MEIFDLGALLRENSYPGRGIVLGRSADDKNAVIAYFIMGRSENSRNRVFVKQGDTLVTRPYDESKVQDPSLIIYSAIRSLENQIIVTNGDQTDTIYDGLRAGKSFAETLTTRSFEPDDPNWTPRISGLLTFGASDFSYQMSILKSADAEGSACARFTFAYPALCGVGHFIHTYQGDGTPLPTFCGEPERVQIPNSIDVFADELWSNLDAENKISLYVRTIDLRTGASEERLINKHG